MKCIYCLAEHPDIFHGPRASWDWKRIAQEHTPNCVWVRTQGETGMPMEKQEKLIASMRQPLLSRVRP